MNYYRVVVIIVGGLGARGYADNSLDSSQCHHAEQSNQPHLQRSSILVPAHQGGGGERSRLVHVSGEHRSNAVPQGIPPGCR